MEFTIGKSVTLSPNQKFNALDKDDDGNPIITIPGVVLFDIGGIYPIRQYQHTIALCRAIRFSCQANKHGEMYTSLAFKIVETKTNLLNAWDQLFILDGTAKSGIDRYEDSKDAFIPGAIAPESYAGHDSPYNRTVEEEEIPPKRRQPQNVSSDRAYRGLPKDFWK